ncbi:hypothetical protein [Leuconostoc lactis]|uniref:hypothetical protein n=1 Tax=Leuconostoc lactis TaxID=1246 RepID=UPI0031D25FF5
MIAIDLTLDDLKESRIKYEEGQSVTYDVVQSAKKAYFLFHAKFEALQSSHRFMTNDFKSALLGFDVALELFYCRARQLLETGRTDSLEIFGYYLEYLDCYHDLAGAINSN